ncbi:podocan-like protein 1 [Andrena cerasifolii]|uniref:podocan-like protein 1 n=1 Tax=Andrena cerasifolii TaxID=2819439 RepID=UPI0040384802
MKQLLRTVAVLVSLLSATSAYIEPNGSEDYPGDCGNYSLTLQLPNFNVIGQRSVSFSTLRCLTIENGGIERVEDGAFDEMPNLRYLNLQGNNISSSDLFSFGNLSSLRKLILGKQQFKLAGEAAIEGMYPQLRYLDLRNSGISGIRNVLASPFPELTHLDLSMNSLENVNFTRPWAEKLTHLCISDNEISQFTLEGYPGLMSLVLDNNRVRTIGEDGVDLVGSTNLRNLSLANNVVGSIRDGAFRDSASLRRLDISMNSLSTIPPAAFQNLHALEFLDLDGNSLVEVPMAVPANTTTLSINCNRIKNLMINSLHHLPHLKTLSLGLNGMESVHEDAFQNQGMLEELYLHYNQLNYLPDDWCRTMRNLRYLDLTGNDFTTFESTIYSGLPSLRHIFVGGNPLEFNASTFATLPKDATAYLVRDWNRFDLTCSR